MLAEPSLQLVSLSAGSGSGKYDSMWLNQDKPVPVAKDMSRSSPEAGCKFSPTARSGTGSCGATDLKCPFVKPTAQARPDAGGGNRFSPPGPWWGCLAWCASPQLVTLASTACDVARQLDALTGSGSRPSSSIRPGPWAEPRRALESAREGATTWPRKEDARSMRPPRRLYVYLTEVLVDLGRCCCARATNVAMRSATVGQSGRGRS